MKFGLRYASLGRYANGPAAVELAQAAEAAGFDSIWTVEHVVVPHAYQSRYPYSPTGRMGPGLEDFPIPDPLIWLAYVASATRTLGLGTAILILPPRTPVVTTKAVPPPDHLARARRLLPGLRAGRALRRDAPGRRRRRPRSERYRDHGVGAGRGLRDRGAGQARRGARGRSGELGRRAPGPGEDAGRRRPLRQGRHRAPRRLTRDAADDRARRGRRHPARHGADRGRGPAAGRQRDRKSV